LRFPSADLQWPCSCGINPALQGYSGMHAKHVPVMNGRSQRERRYRILVRTKLQPFNP
jgi:hypothetical protein